jgi:hypothetical protein
VLGMRITDLEVREWVLVGGIRVGVPPREEGGVLIMCH